MAFINEIFPERISLNAIGGPGFMTNVAVMASGAESRNQEWEFERFEAEVSQAAKLSTEYIPLQAFFRIMGGRANSFRYKDWTDYTCVAGQGFFISAVHDSPAGHQMVKRYTFGSHTVDRIITKPRNNGTVVFNNGGTLDYNTGIVDGTAPTFWYGDFDIHCRFDTDVMRYEAIDRNVAHGLIVTWQSIPIVEVRDDV